MEPMNSILLVEDDKNDIDLTLRALKKSRVANEVDVARDGEEALEMLLDTDRHLPQLVLLDLKLPKIHGLDVLEKIRKTDRTRLLPVVILTSSTEESDRVKGYDRGANSFIVKPVDFSQFAKSVEQLGLYWLVLNAGPPSEGGNL